MELNIYFYQRYLISGADKFMELIKQVSLLAFCKPFEYKKILSLKTF